jgi:hypothetical protein
MWSLMRIWDGILEIPAWEQPISWPRRFADCERVSRSSLPHCLSQLGVVASGGRRLRRVSSGSAG